ncbi:MAG: HD domain-containing protein [Micromonosporaceae bacterium]
MPALWRRDLPPLVNATEADHAGADLVARWSQPHRHYHDLTHLGAVLAVIDEHAAWAEDLSAVRLAAWFHDAVYVPRRDDNERASAALARAVLRRLGVDRARVDEVARLVRLTENHHPAPGDRNGELLCDADLSVLAAPREAYRQYAARIRREYAHVPDRAFRAGRVGVLRRLLALPKLYRIPALAARWEAPARANLTRELDELTAPDPQP